MGDNHQTTTGAILIPALQAAITGILLGLASWAVAALANWERPHLWGATIGAGAMAYTWLWAIRKWHRLLEFNAGMEEAQMLDHQTLDQVRVVVASDNGRQGQFIDLPARRDQLVNLGAGIVQGMSISEGSWSGRGRPFSRSQFRALRDEMVRRGLIRWINPEHRAQGLELTAPGRAVMRRFAAMSPTLSPRELTYDHDRQG